MTFEVWMPLRGMNHMCELNAFAYVKIGVVNANNYQDAFLKGQNDFDDPEYTKLKVRSVSVGDILRTDVDVRFDISVMVMPSGFKRFAHEQFTVVHPKDIDYLIENPYLLKEFDFKVTATKAGRDAIRALGGKLVEQSVNQEGEQTNERV